MCEPALNKDESSFEAGARRREVRRNTTGYGKRRRLLLRNTA